MHQDRTAATVTMECRLKFLFKAQCRSLLHAICLQLQANTFCSTCRSSGSLSSSNKLSVISFQAVMHAAALFCLSNSGTNACSPQANPGEIMSGWLHSGPIPRQLQTGYATSQPREICILFSSLQPWKLNQQSRDLLSFVCTRPRP